MNEKNSVNDTMERGNKSSVTSALPNEKLPKDLQKLVDDEETLLDQIYDGTAQETTDSNLRYAAYATRLRTILLSAHRYVAYTSDVGESFRPVAHPWLIKSAYGISWAYLIGDVGHEGYKAYMRNQRVLHPGVPGVLSSSASNAHDVTSTIEEPPKPGRVPAIDDFRSVMLERALFQSIASMGLPAFTIHSIVRYSGRALKNAKNMRIRTYGPIGLGLAAVPFLPFIFDKPVENGLKWTFHKAFEIYSEPDLVAHKPVHSETKESIDYNQKRKTKDKEKEL